MKRATQVVATVASELWSLLVDDGFLAVVALIAIGAAYLLSRNSVLGAVDAVGWILIALLTASMVVSVRRAISGSDMQPSVKRQE